MISILLGADDFSKKEYINSETKKLGAQLEVYAEGDSVDALKLLQQDLFSKPKIFVLEGIFKSLDLNKDLEKVSNSENQIIIVEEKLDKRSKEVKNIFLNKDITIKEFNLPHGQELNEWITKRIALLKGSIGSRAVGLLGKKLGRDNFLKTKVGGRVIELKEVYNLYEADNEIKKLIAFAGGNEIQEEDVEQLVNENIEIDVFKITNAIADGRKQEALNLIGDFLNKQTGGDEKARVIQLNALLAEQFRNVAVIQDFLKRKISESEILQKTSWKSGRIFVMKKIAGKFNPKKILQLLKKLEALDQELKTAQTPPKVLLDLILVQLF